MNRSSLIKAEALRLGFDACGIAQAGFVGQHAAFLDDRLKKGYGAGMKYMSNHVEKRCDPRLLVENAKSVIVVALNYYPEKKQPGHLPQIAYYAYGNDYHVVIRNKLHQLSEYVNREITSASGRCFTDSAPVLERYWAMRAGIGFIGKNTNLIIPRKGSYFFLGELIVDIPLEYDSPVKKNYCGKCLKCLDACPTKALEKPFCLDAGKCISYLTIEHKGQPDEKYHLLPENRFFGCDICQQVCPWNRFSQPHTHPELISGNELVSKSTEEWLRMNEEEFSNLAKNSPLFRTGLKNLQRNLQKK
ncbi:MAG: tRNA epoxyqueuosine(34) reductase QueG [Candidatus Azobacteroides sp.]|nr:tRNA epoxyqueuosine(34) reductase QueG [Candidatus Azobacteroides sp.]